AQVWQQGQIEPRNVEMKPSLLMPAELDAPRIPAVGLRVQHQLAQRQTRWLPCCERIMRAGPRQIVRSRVRLSQRQPTRGRVRANPCALGVARNVEFAVQSGPVLRGKLHQRM